jgi:hypothetical protein
MRRKTKMKSTNSCEDNEVRFYLRAVKEAMEVTKPYNEDDVVQAPFIPKYLITAIKLPTGAIEVTVNNENIGAKIDYILDAYNDDMQLKTNTNVVMQNIMIV